MLTLNEDDLRPIDQLIIAIFRLSGSLLEGGSRLVEDIGLTPAWWQVLGALALSPVPLTVPQIARNMGLARQSVQRIVDLLDDKALVRLAHNPHHRRAKLVAMTEKGEAVYREAQKRQHPWAERLAAGLSAKELSSVVSVLSRIEQNLALEIPQMADADA
jgi:DNA-binding MarR family transcriptional regulator